MNFFGNPIVRNSLSLYGEQLANIIVPLLLVPYLARVLNPDVFGLVLYTQAFAAWIGLVIDYGFQLSATRELARTNEDPIKVAEIVCSVQGAKICLILPLALIAVLCLWIVPLFAANQRFMWAGLALAISQGLNPLWYFQGLERMVIPVVCSVISKIFVVIAVYVFINNPADALLVIVLQIVFSFGVALSNTVLMYRQTPFAMPRLNQVSQALKLGLSMFFFRSSVSLYTTANAVILGLFVAPAQVAFYVGAEKISKIALSMITPVSQAVFPRMSALVANDKKKADQLATVVSALTIGGSLIMGVIIYLLAPRIIPIALGEGYDSAIIILQILSFLIPIIGVSNVLGIQYMLPHGMDLIFNQIIISAGMINVFFALILVNFYGGLGMAISVVIAELFVTVAMVISVGKHKKEENYAVL